MESLWLAYKTNGNADAREALILHYVGLAHYVVQRLNVHGGGGVTKDDLISHALLGLIDAVERYDPARGVKFETYAITRIRGAVVDMLRSMDWAPRSVRRLESTIRDAYATMEARLGRPATDDEMASALDMTIDAFHDALANIGQSAIGSLEDAIRGGDDDPSGPLRLEGLLDNDNSPSAAAEDHARQQVLTQAIHRLPERERMVITLYYYEGLTLKEIGRVLEVTEARICQIHAKAVMRLSGHLQREKALFCG
ncbi:MAG TPA: FliA/WhiG family RNA polymerase sigma factor [Armatimonadota bacterium]|jgi:RNA polymerase sigma factor for flagellar operon FliA